MQMKFEKLNFLGRKGECSAQKISNVCLQKLVWSCVCRKSWRVVPVDFLRTKHLRTICQTTEMLQKYAMQFRAHKHDEVITIRLGKIMVGTEDEEMPLNFEKIGFICEILDPSSKHLPVGRREGSLGINTRSVLWSADVTKCVLHTNDKVKVYVVLVKVKEACVSAGQFGKVSFCFWSGESDLMQKRWACLGNIMRWQPFKIFMMRIQLKFGWNTHIFCCRDLEAGTGRFWVWYRFESKSFKWSSMLLVVCTPTPAAHHSNRKKRWPPHRFHVNCFYIKSKGRCWY